MLTSLYIAVLYRHRKKQMAREADTENDRDWVSQQTKKWEWEREREGEFLHFAKMLPRKYEKKPTNGLQWSKLHTTEVYEMYLSQWGNVITLHNT